MKRFNDFITEGTWAFSKNLEDYDNAIKEIENIKDKYYGTVGDDQFFDGLDNAIERAKELKKMSEESN